jgi:hypothetical protein
MFTRSAARHALQQALLGQNLQQQQQQQQHTLPTSLTRKQAADASNRRKQQRQQAEQQRRQPIHDASVEGPKNIFEARYYDPRAPGSFGGIDALRRSVNAVEGQHKSKEEVEEWTESQPTYGLHKPARKRFRRNRILVHGVDEQFQADLIDVSAYARFNGGITFLLVCIDVLSKFLWVIPLKNKSAQTVLAGFQQIFAERIPSKLQTDHGTEFANSTLRTYLQQRGVHQFFTWNPDIKASIAERVIRTIMQKVAKLQTYLNTNSFIAFLPDLVHSYNNTYHRSIKMTPTEASDPKNARQAWHNLYGDMKKIPASRKKFKYGLGDHVRLSEERTAFRKGYKQQWTNEVFKVVKQSLRDPVVYRLESLDGEPVIGSFYEQELQRVVKPETWEIEAILDARRKRMGSRGDRNLEYFVKFKGYPDYNNRWIAADKTIEES